MNQVRVDSLQEIPKQAEDTIAAISTPFGESGIGIVRISGSLAEPILKKLFKPKAEIVDFVSHHFYYGYLIHPKNGRPIDEVLVVLMRAPKTYTREDILEIHCHGGYLLLQKVLELVLAEGARIAQPGEFTKRAFLHGRIDLTQAEAVIDLIKAKTQENLEIANQQLRGNLYHEMELLREKLIQPLAFLEAHIDFPEEEIEAIPLSEMKEDLHRQIQKLGDWISTYEMGRVFREGVSVAIAGKTNVGKSSLLNTLLKQDRAIVTPIPGTTRDVIEEVINIYGIPIRLMDTAGLRRAFDSIEQEGVRRAKERVSDADLVLLIIDGSRVLDEDDEAIFQEVDAKKKILVLNKKDLIQRVKLEEIQRRFPNQSIVPISALKGEGIEELKKSIQQVLLHQKVRTSPEHLIVTNIRHKVILEQIKDNLSEVLRLLEEGSSFEFITFEIRSALENLKELVGETTTEEVLNRIFSQFCIGK